MSESLAKKLLHELREALSAGELKALLIGKSIFELQKTKSYADLGYKSFGAFIENECNIRSATAIRYAYKYELSVKYPEHRDKIGRAHTVVCETGRRLMNLDGGKEKLDKIIDRIDNISVEEMNRLYSGAKPVTNDLKFKRIGMTFIEDDYNEFKELEELILKAFDLSSRGYVVLSAMRSLSIEARQLLQENSPNIDNLEK